MCAGAARWREWVLWVSGVACEWHCGRECKDGVHAWVSVGLGSMSWGVGEWCLGIFALVQGMRFYMFPGGKFRFQFWDVGAGVLMWGV